jgi:hypothetical protein
MKKSLVVTSVASLLTFASVAVLPAFALDTGGVQRRNDRQGYRDKSVSVTKSYNFKKSENFSRFRGERERYSKGDRKDYDGYRHAGYGKGGFKGDRGDGRWGHGGHEGRGHGGYGHKGPRS